MATVAPSTLESFLLPVRRATEGPITQARLVRSRLLHAAVCGLGASPWLLDLPPGWQAAGWGLWLPGAGFVAVGGGATLLFPLTLLLFGVAFVAWFGSGMIIAPLIVWGAAAAGAGLLAGGAIAGYAPLVVSVGTIAWLVHSEHRRRQRRTTERQRRGERNAYLPRVIAETRARAVPAPALQERELDDEQLAMLRYVLDRALQPVGTLQGFDRIDQFQTSALRYQLNQVGWTLAIAQRHYAPNFHGYLSEGQRRAIDQYLERDVWGYWRYENAWGNLSLDLDPAKKDNIMLTGYININALLYMNNTGDFRYAEPGSMTFRYDAARAFPHDAHSITQSLLDNFRGKVYSQPYTLFPCEPNWIYTACNFRGLSALTLNDTVFGTKHVDELRDLFRERLEAEFVNLDGAMVSLRSKRTGHSLPFPVPDGTLVKMLSPLYPDLALRYWAITREEQMYREDGELKLRLKGRGVDFGNYRSGHIFTLDGVLGAAQEMGDREVVRVAERALDDAVGRVERDGVLHYDGSNMGNLMVAESRLGITGGWAEALCTRPPESALRGPILAQAPYPEVLVARAISSGDDLDLVLRPGHGAGGRQRLELARLQPGRNYRVEGAASGPLVADRRGRAELEVELTGRTRVTIRPLDSGASSLLRE